MNAIKVKIGDAVSPGDFIGYLPACGKGTYRHMHISFVNGSKYLCLYSYSSDSAKAIYNSIPTACRGNLPGGQICVVESF
jgi:hypothetical protein